MNNDFASELRTAFEDGYVPASGDLEPSIQSMLAAQGQHRYSLHPGRRLAALAVGVATALVIALVVVAPRFLGVSTQRPQSRPSGAVVGTPRPSPTGGVVPWIDTAAYAAPPYPTPGPPSPPAGIPTCRSSDLRAHAGFSGGGLGHYSVEFTFTDHGGRQCILEGFPKSVGFVDSGGNELSGYPVTFNDGGYVPAYPNSGVELLPGIPDGGANDQAIPGQAFLLFQTAATLCGHTPIAGIVVTLQDGGVFRFETGLPIDPYGDCQSPKQAPLLMSSFQLPGYPPAQTTPPTDLDVAVSAPGILRNGAVLDYTVTLTNVSGHTLRFDPCPGYAESLKFAVVANYELNCAAVPELARGQTRTFAMELQLNGATRVDDGTYELGWLIDLPFVEVDVTGPISVVVSG